MALVGYEYRERLNGDTDWDSVVDLGPQLDLTEAVGGHLSNTAYDFQVRGYDAEGNRTEWSNIATASTLDGCGGAADFLAATGISDPTIVAAIEQLEDDLRAADLWDKLIALYPFVGGNATAHSYNLRCTPRFQITWHGTLTHNSDGVTGNGSTGYGDTGLSPLAELTGNDTHLSVYNRTNNTRAEMEAGAAEGGFADRFYMYTQYTGGPRAAVHMHSGAAEAELNPNADGRGFYIGSRTSSSLLHLYKNGTSVANNTTLDPGSPVLPGDNVFIAAINSNGTPIEFSSKNVALVSVGAGLDGTEAAAFTTIVETFQDALGRGVA